MCPAHNGNGEISAVGRITSVLEASRDDRDAARPVMSDLREATRHSVNLGILEGGNVVYVDILAGPDSPRLPTLVGGRWPAHATAIGKAILAFSDPGTVEAFIDAGRRARCRFPAGRRP